MSDEQFLARFAEMERHLNERFDALAERLEGRLGKRIDAIVPAMTARMELLETRLVTAFRNCGSPAEARARGAAANLQALDLEVELLKERVKKLEVAQSRPS